MALHTSRSRAGRFHALDKGLVVHLTRRLHRFFNGQARRVVGRYQAEFPDSDQPASQPPAAEELLPDTERRDLWITAVPFILQATLNAANLASTLVGLQPITEQDPRIQVLLSEAQTHLADVHDTTLDAIRTTLAEGFHRWYSARQIANGVPADDFRGLLYTVAEVYSGRTATIAKTEIAVAGQLAAMERYQEAGVAMLYIVDGDFCGWTTHDDPDAANGTVRHMIDARQYPTGHPNCQRISLPLR